MKIYADGDFISTVSTQEELEQFYINATMTLLEVAEQDYQRCGYYPQAVADIAGNYDRAMDRIRNYYEIL